MKREDLSNLSRAELEYLVFEVYRQMDTRATSNEKRAKEIANDIHTPNDDALWCSYVSYNQALRTMCNFIKNWICNMNTIKSSSNREFKMHEIVMIKGMQNETFEILGIDKPQKILLLHGDWSQSGHTPVSSWHPISEVLHTKLIADPIQ